MADIFEHDNDQKFVLIDFDETLVTEPIGGYEGFEELRGEFGLSDEQIERAKGYRDNSLEEYVSEESVIRSAEDERAHHRKYYSGMGEAMGFSGEDLEKYTRVVVNRRMNELVFEEVEGVRDVFDELGQRGYLRILFSNAFQSRRGLVERMGLDGYFDYIALSAEVGSAKPNEQMFRFVFEELGVAPENGWIVDNEHVNIEKMRELGGKGAVVDLNQNDALVWKGDVPYINHVRELLDLFDS